MGKKVARYLNIDGIMFSQKDDIWLTKVPSHIYMVMLKSKAQSGSFDTNPFYFEAFDMNHLDVSVNGESFPSRAITTKFDKEQYKTGITQIYTNLLQNKEIAPSITLNDFVHGSAIFSINLEPELRVMNNSVFPLEKSANVRMEVGFAKPTPDVISLILYASFPEIISIDHSRAVSLEQTKTW